MLFLNHNPQVDENQPSYCQSDEQCYYLVMNLLTYFSQTSEKKAVFARSIGVAPALLHQWLRGSRPVAIPHCAPIERATAGLVSRKDLRPDDWAKIWPELITGSTKEAP